MHRGPLASHRRAIALRIIPACEGNTRGAPGGQSRVVDGLIYATFEIIADRFLESVLDRIIKFITSDYEIFTNYLGSYLQFDDPHLQDRHEEWRAQLE